VNAIPHATRVSRIDASPAAIRRAAERFLALRSALSGRAVAGIEQVLETRPVDPRTATVEEAWRVIWDKPLFAHVLVEVGEAWVAQVEPFMPAAWETWGRDGGAVAIRRIGTGKASSDFTVSGSGWEPLRLASRTAVHRLYAIQNAGQALRRRAGRSPLPVRDFWNTPLDRLVPALSKEFGWGWGAVTVLHMLTDFGVACKPDIHVMRTLRALGLSRHVGEKVSPHEAIEINVAIRTLCLALGELTPRSLRRLDLELMALSRDGVITANPENV
jgi:hypothetical protein